MSSKVTLTSDSQIYGVARGVSLAVGYGTGILGCVRCFRAYNGQGRRAGRPAAI